MDIYTKFTDPDRPHVVVVGAGFGGLRAARELGRHPVNITLVDSNNYHLFQPLLYQVAMAGISTDEIAYPVRGIFWHQENFRFHYGRVEHIDLANRAIFTSQGPLQYDYLILAVGSANFFFGIESMERNSLPLKSIPDALAIRHQVLRNFEMASHEPDPARRRAMLTFVIVGGGPTGVECAGAMSELFSRVLVKDYPGLRYEDTRIVLMEGLDSLLPAMPAEQGRYAQAELKRKGVEVMLKTLADGFDCETVTLKNGEQIPARTVIWAAGVRANPLLKDLGVELDRSGRAVVSPSLQIPARPEVFVIGDSASLPGPDGKPLPMVAPVAMQQGVTAARSIARILQGEPALKFEYKDPGMLATIGRSHAVAFIKGIKFTGFPAWVVWLVVHIFQLIGFRNRLVVLVDWGLQYILGQRVLRLIEDRCE